MTTDAFPLDWPTGRARTVAHRREASNFDTTLGKAIAELFAEVGRLGARHIVVSSNIPLRQDGRPYATSPKPTDPGVAVYFEHKGKSMCFACDRWTKVEDNMRAITKTIDALRGVARWGTGDMMSAAFAGFTALPAPGGSASTRAWREVLGFGNPAVAPSAELLRERFRARASANHPDKGGTDADMAAVNLAFAQAKEELGYV